MRRWTARHADTIAWVGPDAAHANLRWITRVNRDTGRAYARAPRAGVRLVDLRLRRDADFGAERIVPRGHVVIGRLAGR